MARRRRIQGRPLLVATATAAMVIGCGGGNKNQPPPPGNLMPPPTVEVEVCVDTVPEAAKVSIQAASNVVFSERCAKVEAYQGSTGKLHVEAEGYLAEDRDVVLEGPKVELKVELTESKIPEIAEPPVGNLMPPPEPPVGNLMPPQEVDLGKPAPLPTPDPAP